MKDAMDNQQQGFSVDRQLRNYLHRHRSNIFVRGIGLVAAVVHHFVLCLQLTPAAPLFGNGRSRNEAEPANEYEVCYPVHPLVCDPTVVDLAALRSSINERLAASTAVPPHLQEHSPRTIIKEDNYDRE